MNLCGEAVVHKTFGAGHIIGFANNYVTIQFNEGKAERIFEFPSSFGSIIEMENEAFMDQIKLDKDLISKELGRNQKLNEELIKLAIPAPGRKVNAKVKRAFVIKPTL